MHRVQRQAEGISSVDAGIRENLQKTERECPVVDPEDEAPFLFKSKAHRLDSTENNRDDTGLHFVLETPEEGHQGYLMWKDLTTVLKRKG